MNYLISLVIAAIVSFGVVSFSPPTIWDEVRSLGSTNFPTSLDALTNPSGTDSVATVSHSSQHTNANDAIEAIETKVGIGASTAVTNSVFAGTGAGTSAFVTYATSTQFSATNFFATGSTTLQNFSFANSIGGLSTTTSATTTNFFSTNASTTNLSGTNINGFGLSNCSGSDFVQWSGGVFGCAASSVDLTTYATTSDAVLATTTLSSFPTNSRINIMFVASSTSARGAVHLLFNKDKTAIYDSGYTTNGDALVSNNNTGKIVLGVDNAAVTGNVFINIEMTNLNGQPKTGTWTLMRRDASPDVYEVTMGGFTYASSTQIYSVSFMSDSNNYTFPVGTYIKATGY